MGNLFKNLLILLVIVLVAYNVYTGVTLEKLVIPGVAEFYFDPTRITGDQDGTTSGITTATSSDTTITGERETEHCTDELYNRLAKAQNEGITMLIQGKPDALVRISETLGRVTEAIKHCPDDARFYMLQGYIHKDMYQSHTPLLSDEQRRDHLRYARGAAEQALGLDPNNAGAHNLMGNILFLEGNCDKAIAEYDRALELNRNDGYRSIIEGDKQLAVQARDNNTCFGP